MRKSRTKDYLLLVLLIALVILASIGVWHLVAPKPLPEQSFDTRKVADPTEEKGYFYREKEALFVLENEEISISKPKGYIMWNYSKREFDYNDKDDELPENAFVRFSKLDMLSYALNVDFAKDKDTINLNLDLKLVDCIRPRLENIYNYSFKVSNHPWIKIVFMELEFKNGMYRLNRFYIREQGLMDGMGKSYLIVFNWW